MSAKSAITGSKDSKRDDIIDGKQDGDSITDGKHDNDVTDGSIFEGGKPVAKPALLAKRHVSSFDVL